ncbi:MAG: transposase [Ruminococcus sp.]|jgi:REP element-mobilizing transposase RayT|nr:transposase [Ruminococcus sp.]
MRYSYKRRLTRRTGFDYSANGRYFVTVCSQDGALIFSEINEEGVLILSEIGEIVKSEIERVSSIYSGVTVEKYVIMPNHIHIIIAVKTSTDEITPTISRIIQQWKGSITKTLGYSIWQRSFHDHIIMNTHEYEVISDYIENNPKKWRDDRFFLA